jgi:hypothetical protein
MIMMYIILGILFMADRPIRIYLFD